MSCCRVAQPNCRFQIDYSPIIVADRQLPYIFELDPELSNLYPNEGENQRFCYRVKGVGEDISTFVSLSHWVLSLCPEITPEQITNISVTIGGVPQPIDDNVELFIPPDTDPTTGCSGLKFDYGLNKVLGEPNSIGLFCFELTTPYPMGAVSVCVKGGSDTISSALAICGPVCSTSDNCLTTASQLVNVCVPITIEPCVHVGPTRTICCGTATIGEVPCGEVPRPSCTFTVSQLICVEVPLAFRATATPGEEYVTCGDAATGECVCPTPEE
ncbi:MAG: hypothetical protein PHF24_09240 [Syntrophomonas sp.]|nr:hypothetical protein [Syntrophomonas sp.]